jgi:hypothetical protein
MRSSLILLAAAVACAEGAAGRGSAATKQAAVDSTTSTGSVVATAAAAPTSTPTPGAPPAASPATPPAAGESGVPDTGIVRGLYVNRFAAQSAKKLRHLIDIADSTEINAFVVDVKDEFGLNYHSADPSVSRNAGTMGKIRDMRALVDTLKAHHILPIARMVVFKDSVAARANPDHVIRKSDGSAWRDKQGLTWVNPYDQAIWEYNLKVAEEVVKLGFSEVQFDYIRFPEPYKSLPEQVFPNAAGRTKPQALHDFLKLANEHLDKLGVRLTADIFGLVTTVGGPLEIGQEWEKVAPVTDVLLPMVYPSHYPRHSLGVAWPNASPYDIVFRAISRARERDAKLGITGQHVRPWLQAFSLGPPEYGPKELEEQKRAVYDAGYEGWILWHPGSKFDHIRAGLEGTTASRRKNPPLPRPRFAE